MDGADEQPSWLSHSQNPLLNCITRITYPDSEGHGTGFYFNYADESFLITNRHVIKDEDSGHDPDQITYYIRDYQNVANVNPITIDVSNGEGSDWFSHPDNDELPNGVYIDVAAVKINQTLSDIDTGLDEAVTGSRGIVREMLLAHHPNRDYEDVGLGSTISLIGYPGVFVDQYGDFPVLRSGIVASKYGLPFNGDPVFIVDARMHKGTSGAPVLITPGSTLANATLSVNPGYALLGIHSMTYQQPGADHPDERWLDLNGVWYADLIEEILSTV